MYRLYLILLGGWLLTSIFMVDNPTTPPAWTAEPETRLYDLTAIVGKHYRWKTTAIYRLCDDNKNDTFINLSKGDFWKIFVR